MNCSDALLEAVAKQAFEIGLKPLLNKTARLINMNSFAKLLHNQASATDYVCTDR